MGYHRDGEHFNLTPFETEMRRRIWWQILLQDASFTGMDQMAFPRTFDTKQPQNFNDVDIFPGSTRPIKPRDRPTEMGFILIITSCDGIRDGFKASWCRRSDLDE
jgi:hypothetical protein